MSSPLLRELPPQSGDGKVIEPVAELLDRGLERVRPLAHLSHVELWTRLATRLRALDREAERDRVAHG